MANGVLQVTNTSTSNTTQNATAIAATNNSVSSPAMRATNAGYGTALELNVACNPAAPACFTPAPMKVNSDTKVQNLNSDELDGKDSSELADGVNGVATNADKLDGKDSSELGVAGLQELEQRFTLSANTQFQQFNLGCPAGKQALGGGFSTEAFNSNLKVKTSAPEGGIGTGWVVTASNSGSTVSFLDVEVVCAIVQ